MPITTCLQCQKALAPGERRFSYGSGWVCFDCGYVTRDASNEAGLLDGYAATDYTPPAPPLKRRMSRQKKTAIAVAAAAVLIPATALLCVYLVAAPDRPATELAVADPAAPSPFAPAVGPESVSSAPTAPATDALRRYEQLLAVSAVHGAAQDYVAAGAALREALPLVQAHPEWRGMIVASKMSSMIEQYDRLAAQQKAVSSQPAPTAPPLVETADAAPQSTLAPVQAPSNAPSNTPPNTPSPQPPMASNAPRPSPAPFPAPSPAAEPMLPQVASSENPPSSVESPGLEGGSPKPDPLPPPNSLPPPPPRAMLEDLIDNASSDLIAGDLNAAAAGYLQAIRARPSDVRGRVGKGLTLYFQGSVGSAIEQLELAYSQKSTHLTAVNLAAVSMESNPLRSSRVMYDYLRTTNTLDEAAYDHFTLALWNAQGTKANNGAFWQMVRYHEIYERRLRLARGSDERRFGPDWMPARDATEAIERLSLAREKVMQTREKLQQLVRMQRTADKVGNAQLMMYRTGVHPSALPQKIDDAREKFDEARAQFREAAPFLGFEIPIVVP